MDQAGAMEQIAKRDIERLDPIRHTAAKGDTGRVIKVPGCDRNFGGSEAKMNCLKDHLGIKGKVRRVPEKRN